MKSQKVVFPALLCAILLVVSGCGKDSDSPTPDPGNDDVTVDNVTYANFAGGLFQSSCSGCHTGTGQGTGKWVFSGYSSVTSNLALINDAVIVRRIMPQGSSLSSRQLELLKAWIDKGAPQN
ncbi:hypothetical protein [Parapedobacter tibetensis]|uniref:hypothetical protein n=1 Tax=Parapedobacter tibetensis TaxID=2972951 RepID=UPI00214DDA4E|nr:hypothetical protein [Parapedobacter tibetensis]